ncbi:MAG: hypothetical protein HZB20_09860 [Chloroflexi bacterium]|nr:hypothetical protein [Chloroflexota bacterium]
MLRTPCTNAPTPSGRISPYVGYSLVAVLLRSALSLLIASSIWAADDAPLSKLERSYWLHASLASLPQRGYWGLDFPAATKPTEREIQNAARLLTGDYAANRLYLIYHNELSPADAEQMFASWRRHCPPEVEIVPTLVLCAYDKHKSEVFSTDELGRLAGFFKRTINPARIAIYDVHSGRDQGRGLATLSREFPNGVIRVGIQPDEAIAPPFVAAVQDTWSAFCHGKANDDWQQPGFGAQTLRQWVEKRNTGRQPVAWDLVVVAWDYAATKRGEYPGYDDARKNMPLPAGRNALAAQEILRCAKREVLAGFSSDLFILHVNSRSTPHDRPSGAFYATLKRGEVYRGYYAAPFNEVTAIYRELKQGRLLTTPSSHHPPRDCDR